MKNRKYLAALCLGISLLAGGCASAEGSESAASLNVTESEKPEIGTEVNGTEEEITEIETETKPEPVVQTVTITAAGDCTLGATQTHGYEGSFHQYYDNYGETYFFDGVREVFENDDFTLVNLECVLTTSEERVEKTWNLKGRPEYTGIMTSSSVEACSLGNNHTRDYGDISLTDTEDALDAAGIVYGYNDHVGVFTTPEGVTIGFVSVNMLAESEQCETYMRNGIEDLKEQGVDLILTCCHWGIERDYYPTGYQRTMAHKLIDWGADLVLGCHPHVLQGVEVYNGKIICYSLGNFCFGGNRDPSDKDTMMFQQTFTLVDGVLQPELSVKIIPCRLSSITERNDFQPTIVSGEKKQSIIDNVNTYSAPYSDVKFDAEGMLVTGTDDKEAN